VYELILQEEQRFAKQQLRAAEEQRRRAEYDDYVLHKHIDEIMRPSRTQPQAPPVEQRPRNRIYEGQKLRCSGKICIDAEGIEWLCRGRHCEEF
jgi:hypothetical protein